MAQTKTQVANDDLSRIRQLGPGTIKCFEDAGLDGLRSLAAKTPSELSALCGYPVDRIMKEDWIGQARRMTGGKLITRSWSSPRPMIRRIGWPRSVSKSPFNPTAGSITQTSCTSRMR